MRWIIPITLTFVASPATATIPVGKAYGSWQVTSASSVSGDGVSDDSSVILTQGNDEAELQVMWMQGKKVWVSINLKKCNGDEEFEAQYGVDLVRWLQMSRRQMQRRLKVDFSTWLDQARLSCDLSSVVSKFTLERLEDAVADFDLRLRDFSNVK